jgi:hypothetical protein
MIRSPLASTSLSVMPSQAMFSGGAGLGSAAPLGGKVEGAASSMVPSVAAGTSSQNQ